jgi:serine/threonine-protein phosphatase PP1 catalytic subunit
LLGDVHG